MWMILAFLSGLGAAAIAIITKVYLKDFNPFFVTLLFSMITVILLSLIDIFTKKINCALIMQLSVWDMLPLVIAGIINTVAFSFYLGALQYGKIHGAVAIDRLGILFVVIFSAIFLQEVFTIKSILGAALMIIGVFLLNS